MAENVAKNLRRLRDKAGLTQQELAMKAGLSISAVCKLEQGKNTDPRMSTLQAIAKVLGVRVNDLIE
jgi:transcriptional regulator with XRE-family HTH domain